MLDPATLSRRDLRRLTAELWADERCDGVAAAVVAAALASRAISLDRALVIAYLRHFPRGHAAFESLRTSAADAAGRNDWPWRRRGERWQLWDPNQGPDRLAEALLAPDASASLLHDVGLEGDLAQAGFAGAAVESACRRAGSSMGHEARRQGERLIGLVQELRISPPSAALIWALLKPWTERQPADDYKERLSGFLLTRYGHPRLQPNCGKQLQRQCRAPMVPLSSLCSTIG